MATTPIGFNDPQSGNGVTQSGTIDLEHSLRAGGDTYRWYLKGNIAANNRVTEVYSDVNDRVERFIQSANGQIPDGEKQTRVTTAYVAGATSLIVQDTSQFTADRPIWLKQSSQDAEWTAAWQTAKLDGVTFTIPASSVGSIATNFSVGTIVSFVEPNSNSMNFENKPGLIEMARRNDAPTIVPVDATGQEISFTITAPASNAATIVSYDIFVTDVALTELTWPINIQPSVADALAASPNNATMYYNTSTDTLTAIAGGAETLYVYCQAKTATGQLQEEARSENSVETTVVVAAP